MLADKLQLKRTKGGKQGKNKTVKNKQFGKVTVREKLILGTKQSLLWQQHTSTFLMTFVIHDIQHKGFCVHSVSTVSHFIKSRQGGTKIRQFFFFKANVFSEIIWEIHIKLRQKSKWKTSL